MWALYRERAAPVGAAPVSQLSSVLTGSATVVVEAAATSGSFAMAVVAAAEVVAIGASAVAAGASASSVMALFISL